MSGATRPGCRQLAGRRLRKAGCKLMAESACNVHEIMAVSGHRTLKEVARYTEAVDRRRLAVSAMAKVRTLSDKLDEKFVKKG